jgi:uncharacterized protein YndB with AHSA1/START domain
MNTANERLGEVLHDGDTIGLRFERHLAHPPERVWRALTQSDQLQHWFPADIIGERRDGAPLALHFWPALVDKHQIPEPIMSGQLLTWDPPRRFSLLWDRDTLIFELHPSDAGTRLVFTTWVVDTTAGVHLTAAGYHLCLDQLVTLVATDDAPPFVDQDTTAYEIAYAEVFGV